MTTYRATFVRIIDGKATNAKVHPTFSTSATDNETIGKEAVRALRAIPFMRGKWRLKAIEPEDEKPKRGAGQPQLWEVAAEQIIERILAGKYKPGTKLPSPHTLSKEISISSSSIYSAYRYLRDEGWVFTKRGAGNGTFVKSKSEWPKRDVESCH